MTLWKDPGGEVPEGDEKKGRKATERAAAYTQVHRPGQWG